LLSNIIGTFIAYLSPLLAAKPVAKEQTPRAAQRNGARTQSPLKDISNPRPKSSVFLAADQIVHHSPEPAIQPLFAAEIDSSEFAGTLGFARMGVFECVRWPSLSDEKSASVYEFLSTLVRASLILDYAPGATQYQTSVKPSATALSVGM
jgi:hypothetical protein